MTRWIWAFCLLSAISGLSAQTDTIDLDVSYITSELQWLRIGKNGTDDHNKNATIFPVLTDDEISQVTYSYYTRPGQFPYMVTIMIYYYGYYYHICGGVIKNRHTILTVAHCLRYIDYYTYYVGVGFHDLRRSLYNPGSQIIKVFSHTIHSQYDHFGPGVPHNIALLHLECNIKYNYYVKPAPLATKHDGRFGSNYCYMIGYGKTSWGNPRILMRAYIYSITNYKCKLFWAVTPKARILGSHLCVYRYPVSACYGDAGGPVICRGKVAGLISWGRYRCNGCFPTVCTRVSSYNKWITKNSIPE